MNQILSNKLIVFTSLTVISSSLLLLYFVSKRKYRYETVAKISKLFIYPVKSLSGVEVQSLHIEKVPTYGKYKDRQFMLIDKQNIFITLRTEPTLTLIKLSLHNGNEIWFDAQHLPTLKIAVQENIDDNNVIDIVYRDYSMKGIDCGAEACEWFSKYLSKENIRLIQHVSQFEFRPARTKGYFSPSIEKKYPIIYQDGVGVHLVNQNSLIDLNSRLNQENEVTYNNFRPNILVIDCDAYDEDNWIYSRINKINFNLKPCDRCILTTVDPKTGQKKDEPLKTLKTYRLARDEFGKKCFGSSPLFGTFLAPLNEGNIFINDLIFAKRNA